jgi:diguanylate cyclase (GGDEF)-like protein
MPATSLATDRPAPLGPRPANEQSRLATLREYRILGTEPEAEYDDLVRLAAAVAGTEYAAIGLVDEHVVWSKAAFGVDRITAPRDQTACSYVVLDPRDVFEVPDTAADSRFSTSPLAEAGFRHYTGAPLAVDRGTAVGSLCVFDRRPRRLTDGQRSVLKVLARQVVAHMQLRHALDELVEKERDARESEARYRHLSLHDPLTGLANRARFHAELASCADPSVGLCYVDLDEFKKVNDRYGHEAGDTVLKHVARALVTAAGPGRTVARIGGDEFVVIVPAASETTMAALARRISDAVPRPVAVDPDRVSVGCSTGWAVGRASDGTDALLRRADIDMYRHKATRRAASA